jgi:hypothetical protein
LQHLQDIDSVSQIVWYPAVLDQTGALYTTWSLQIPAGIEGPHRLWLRTFDFDWRVDVKESIWSGEIDTKAPTATLSFWDEEPNRGAFFACDASDYNLSLSGINCPVPGKKALSLLEYQDAQWFVELFSPLKKLERAATEGGYWLQTKNTTPELTACDLYGNCTTVTPTAGSAPVPSTSSINTRRVSTFGSQPTRATTADLAASTTATTTVRIEQPPAGSSFTDLSASIPISGFLTA